MNKNEIVRLIYTTVNEAIKGKSNLTLVESEDLYDVVVEAIKGRLMEGTEVRVPSFGKFYVNHTAPRTIPHPRIPGQTIDVGATRQIRFKAYPSMKGELNGKNED